MFIFFYVLPIDTSVILLQSADDGEGSDGRVPTTKLFRDGSGVIASITKSSIKDDVVFICGFLTVGPKERKIGKVMVPNSTRPQSSSASERKNASRSTTTTIRQRLFRATQCET